MTNIVIVEDDDLTRSSLASGLSKQPDIEVIAAVANVQQALAVLNAGTGPTIDVMLVDLGLPDGPGEDVIRAATQLDPPIEVMVITVFGDEQHVISAIEAGASGYLLKDADTASIAAAIGQLLEGGSPITPVIARHILRRFQPEERAGAGVEETAQLSATPAEDVPQLTPRETEVLQMVARGYTNNEIGDLLELSFHTVNSHVKHIYRKLSVRSRSEAVFEASQLGIIDIQQAK